MIRITKEVLHRCLKAVRPFASEDATRFHLCGVLFETVEHDLLAALNLVTTDGHCLAHTRALSKGTGESLVLSSEDADILLKILRPTKRCGHLELEVVIARNTLTVTGPDISFVRTGLTSDGTTPVQFPPYRQVIPERTREPAVPTFTKPIKGEKTEGRQVAHEVGFNALYLGKVGASYKAFDPETTRGMRMQVPPTPLDPVLFDADHPDTGDLRLVVMPMRI